MIDRLRQRWIIVVRSNQLKVLNLIISIFYCCIGWVDPWKVLWTVCVAFSSQKMLVGGPTALRRWKPLTIPGKIFLLTRNKPEPSSTMVCALKHDQFSACRKWLWFLPYFTCNRTFAAHVFFTIVSKDANFKVYIVAKRIFAELGENIRTVFVSLEACWWYYVIVLLMESPAF